MYRPLSQVGSRRKRCPGQFGQDGMSSIPATPSTKHASCFPPSSMPASIEISIKRIVCGVAVECQASRKIVWIFHYLGNSYQLQTQIRTKIKPRESLFFLNLQTGNEKRKCRILFLGLGSGSAACLARAGSRRAGRLRKGTDILSRCFRVPQCSVSRGVCFIVAVEYRASNWLKNQEAEAGS